MRYKNALAYFGIVFLFAVVYIHFESNNKFYEDDSKFHFYINKIQQLEEKLVQLQNHDVYSYAHYNITEIGNECNIVDVVIVCAGYNASREVSILIKSILFHRRCPLHVHFVVNSVSKAILSNLFRTWNIPQFTISFYLLDKLKGHVSWIPTTHYSGTYGLIKLALLEILPTSLKRAIVLDIDMVFLSDINLVWKFFETFNSSQAIGLVENQSEWYTGKLFKNYNHWPALGKGFNTGIILMDCEKLRKLKWMNLWQSIAKTNLETMATTSLADQDIFNCVIKEIPTIVYKLPCTWNVQLSENSQAESCYRKQIYNVKVVHWNSPLKQHVQNRHTDYFRNIYESFIEYDGSLLTVPLFNCVNDYGELYYETTAHNYCENLLSKSLRLHRTHIYFLPYSYQPKAPHDVTLLLQLSIDRLSSLHNIALHWDGPISVVIFLSDTDIRKLLHFVEQSSVLNQRNDIGYHIVYRNFDETVYPINFLRNVALKHVNTSFV